MRQADRIVRELGAIRSDVDAAIMSASASRRQQQTSPQSSSNIHATALRHPPTLTHASVTSELHEQLRRDAERDLDRRRQQALTEPAPLEDYLRKPVPVEFNSSSHAPQALHQPLSPSQYNAPIPSSSCTEVEELLKKVQANKAYLENNLDIIARATTEEELYNLVENLYQDENAREKARIRKEVDCRISAIQHEIQQELLVLKAAATSQRGPIKLPAEKDGKPAPGNKHKSERWKPSRKKTVQARINTGLKREQKSEAEDKGKEKGKENVPAKHPQVTSKPKKLPAGYTHNKDEQYVTRVYGKAAYQAQRRSLKTAPYLRYATEHSPKKAQSNRPAPVVHTKGTEVKSHKTQTKETSMPITNLPHTNQFYFDPYQSTPASQPLPTVPSVGPTHGQLIPMAIPLGEPRVGAGLSQPVTITTRGPEEGESRPVQSPRQKTTNVAVVNMVSERRPKLEVHHLPSVDIDTAPPTPAPSEDSFQKPSRQVEVSSPEPPSSEPSQDDSLREAHNREAQPSPQFSGYLEVADTKIEESSSEDDLPDPGISLPGYRESPKRDYHGPAFPPKVPPSHLGASSDVLAAELRRKDVLEHQAVEWIEQELMARMISELNDVRQAAREPRDPVNASSPDVSVVSGDESQTSMVEAYGPAGFQLFVDAGQPVNPELVNDLVRDVLEEKIAAMLGQRQREPQTPITVEPQPQHEQTLTSGSPIPTPEVTPKASPVHTPLRATSPITTPAASIAESSIAESEPESLKESLIEVPPPREATPAPLPAPSSPVTTPTTTPPPEPPKAPTPELSPRESPVPLLLDETDLPTPAATPVHISPEPVPVEEKIEESPPRSPTPAVPIIPIPPTPSPLPQPSVSFSEPIETESEASPGVSTVESASETVGKEISEGEWLISKSEGQVDLIQDVLAAKEMKLFESTSADSTMRGTDELERDSTMQEPPSEGEILPGKVSKFNLADDPVVALLARLGEPLQSTPQYRPPVSRRPTSNEARSPGEVSIGQRPSFSESTERFVIEQVQTEAASARAEGGSFDELREMRLRLSPGELDTSRREKQNAAANQQGSDSTLRISHLQGAASRQNNNSAMLSDYNAGNREVRKSPVKNDNEGKPSYIQSPPSPIPTPQPRVINVTAPKPRVIQVGGESPDREEGEIEVAGASGGEGRNLDVGGMTPVEDLLGSQKEGGSSKRQPMPAGGIFGTQTISDIGDTRTMTPDAINIDALLQSGYLSQTFSQSEAGTSDFERTGGTYGNTGRLGQSGDLRMTSGATPFTMTEDSLEVPKMKAEKGPRTFSVTLPSAQGMHDIGDSSDGDMAQLDTISDVSEISAGDL